ncbi:MAG: glycosyl hydrolase family 2, partial [Gemmatimonadaceae bacterium]
VDSSGYTFAGGTSGWNTKPAIQYVPKGRRVFGPYTFSSGGSVELVDKKRRQGEGRFWLRVPESRTRMLTTISNPMTRDLEMEILVNGSPKRSVIHGGDTVTVESPISGGEKPLAISFRGDRRLVLLETDFK